MPFGSKSTRKLTQPAEEACNWPAEEPLSRNPAYRADAPDRDAPVCGMGLGDLGRPPPPPPPPCVKLKINGYQDLVVTLSSTVLAPVLVFPIFGISLVLLCIQNCVVRFKQETLCGRDFFLLWPQGTLGLFRVQGVNVIC